MNRKIPYDQGLIAIVLALLGFGLIMVFSTSAPVSRELYGSQTAIFSRQLIAMAIGMTGLMITMKIDYRLYQRLPVVCLLVGISFLLLGYVLQTPGNIHGTRRWLDLGPVNFQPSELAKLAVIVFTSYYLVWKKEYLDSIFRGLLPYLTVVGTIILLVLKGPDLGTALSITITAVFLMFIGGVRYRYFLALAIPILPTLYFQVVRVPYRLNRVLAFLDPEKDPLGISYQIRQSLIAVGSGGWNGLGFAQGKQKLSFLPEPHTDFIYAVVGEELGFFGCLTILLLFSLLFWRGVRISLRADSPFGTFLGLGIVSMISFQALINMSVALSLLPTKGLPLPFISVGGSSIIVMLSSVGILLNISRQGSDGGDSESWIKRNINA